MKKITARIENYTGQDGQVKGKYIEIGALGLSQQNKEYILLNPNVNLAGVLMQQNIMAQTEGKPANKNIMCNVFDNQQQNQQSQSNGQSYQQTNNQNQQQNQGQQQNYQNTNNQRSVNAEPDMDDD